MGVVLGCGPAGEVYAMPARRMSGKTLTAHIWLVEVGPLLRHISRLSIPTSMASTAKTTTRHHIAIDLIVPGQESLSKQ